ncbi:MAG: hypothetical protein DRP70_07885 [Spirochaetes bacterium]|nr:MAG: hypothetical protein DRP70_07885 [Spirochaetota bacterium]
MIIRSYSRILLILCVLTSGITALTAQNVNIAVLGVENLNRDPRYDYLEGMILGVMMYDFTRVDDVSLVERARIDRIIDEQNLRLTGLLNDEDTARQVGQLAGADYLIEGDYAFLGRDLVINMRIMDSAEGTTTAVSVRGYTENSIHELAEQIVKEITGKPVILAGIEGERSLLSLSDEEPGSIEFYCNFIDGEIFVDEEFYGYTPGGRIPTLLEDLSPGAHTIRVEGGNDFGEIIWPEILFVDWERTVDVKTGRKSVVRAVINHFNRLIINARDIYSKSWHLEPGNTESIVVDEDGTYVDRNGKTIPVRIRMNASIEDERPVIHIRIDAEDENYSWDFDSEVDEINLEESAGPVEIDFERDWYSSHYWSVALTVRRNDLWQGMHRGEPSPR